MKNLILFFLISVFLISCKTTDDHLSAAGNWGYNIEITNKGTRSEGQWGHLSYKGNEVKGYFQSIMADNTLYVYHVRRYAWDFGGYKITRENVMPKLSSVKITQDELKNGWYKATLAGKKINTPESWIWIKRDSLEGFLNPEMIDKFIATHHLKKQTIFDK